jgi:hypothetical protein
MAGYLLDDQSIARLATLLREYEAGNLGNRDRNVMPRNGPSYPIVHVVRVTSTTPTSGYYPGKLMTYVAATDTWTDDVDIKIKDINGGVPSVQRYLGRYAGINSYGNPVYMVILSGGGGGTILSIDVVTSLQCVDGEMLPNWTTLCIPGANICTTTTTTTTTSTAAPTTTSTTSTGGG